MSLPQLCTTNLLPDGNMEEAGVSEWVATASSLLNKNGTTRPGSTGSQSLYCANFGSPNPGFRSVSGFEAGKTYRMTGWVLISQSGGPQPAIFDALYGELWRGDAVANSWQYFDVTFTNQRAEGPIFFSDVNLLLEYSLWDDIMLCEVTSDSSTVEKRFFYRVYDNSGAFITAWDDVVSEPTFNQYINTGPSEMKISLARPFNDFGESYDVNFDNKVDVLVHDSDTTAAEGKLLYSGFISAYEPTINGGEERVSLTLLPYSSRLGFDILTVSGGATTQANFYSVDPTDIAKTILDNYTTTASGEVNYSPFSISPTNTLVSYNFNAIDYRGALDKVLELTPEDWYWAVDAENTYSLKKKSASANHELTLGKEISDMQIFKNSEQIVNVVLFTGGELSDGSTLYKEYKNTGSIAAFGRRVLKISDGRVTRESTAETIANKIIKDKGVAEVRVQLKVVDNNTDKDFGYDIESFKIGETVSINDPDNETIASLWDVSEWDVDSWDFAQEYILSEALQINAINYSPDFVTLQLSSRAPEVTKRIKDVDRNLSNYINKDLEGAPS